MISIVEILIILTAYLIGSIPIGLILAYKSTGKNIRKHGSGNIGSTNVKRIAGRKIAIQTQLLDMLKGLIPVATTILLVRYQFITTEPYSIYLIAFASIIGHDFSFLMKFKGGKGVNTTLGATIILAPVPVLSGVLVYYIVKWTTKYVSLGSLLLGLTIFTTGLFIYGTGILSLYLFSIWILMIFTHRTNIVRLLNDTETKA